MNISGNVVTLENMKSKDRYTTDIYTLDNNFRYDYCTTCHSAQGASINGKITIHAWEKSYLVSREWIWCALTRSTDFNDVLFYKGATNNGALNEENLHRYLANKVKNYKLQDEAKNRKIYETKYVNVECFMKRLNGNCQNCSCRFEVDVANGYLTNNITCQRLNNELAHHQDNCKAWCKMCNCSAK